MSNLSVSPSQTDVERREAEIRERLAAATPGPWREQQFNDKRIVGPEHGVGKGRKKGWQPVVMLEDDGGCSDPECCGSPSYSIRISEEDARFIASAPTDIAFLLSEIDRLRGALHESRKDRERLDWLEAERASVFAVVEDEFDNRAVPALLRFSVEVDHYKTRIGGGFCDVTGVAPALREAIDAARAGNGETTA